MSRGQLFVVSAPSGAGKTTLCRRLLETTTDLVYSVSTTTRAPRPGEEEGRDYFFVDREKFERMIAAGEFLEWAEVFGRFYGTTRAWVEARLDEGRDVLADVDVDGAAQLKKTFPQAAFIFIVPPTMAELERRLTSRSTETRSELERRLAGAVQEIKAAERFDFLVINDRLDEAAADLAAIVRVERLRPVRRTGFWANFFNRD